MIIFPDPLIAEIATAAAVRHSDILEKRGQLEDNPYHNVLHMQRTAQYLEYVEDVVDTRMRRLCQAAALFHDVGHPGTNRRADKHNVGVAASEARSALRAGNWFSKEDNEIIIAMILDTVFPMSMEKTLELPTHSKRLRDADLWNNAYLTMAELRVAQRGLAREAGIPVQEATQRSYDLFRGIEPLADALAATEEAVADKFRERLKELILEWNQPRGAVAMKDATIVHYPGAVHTNTPSPALFRSEDVDAVLAKIRAMLIAKNEAYGDAALNPARIFSKASPTEQIRVRIDDKLSRLMRGKDYADEDTVLDLMGYLVLLRVAAVKRG